MGTDLSGRTAQTRRRFVAGVTVAIAGLAGCSGGGSDGDSGGDDEESMDDSGGGERHTVAVGPGGDLRFDPDSLTVAAGDTVEFTWENGGHNIVVDSQPDGADWSGVEEIQDEGFSHTHTFETTGEYRYHCDPHESAGMEGVVTVESA